MIGRDDVLRRLRPLLYAIPVALLAYYLWPIWQETSSWGGTRDWGYFFGMAEVDRHTILDYGQFPLWNPYGCGGFVHLANPQTFFLGPTLLLILIFGPAIGLRLTLTLGLVFAFDGMRRLAADLKLQPAAGVVAGTGYAICGALAQHLGGGHVGFFGFGLLPYVLHCFHRALDGERRHLIYGALFLAWILCFFGVYPFPYACLALGVYGLATGIAKKRVIRSVGIVSAVVVGALVFSAVRMLPLLDFITGHPRTVTDSDMLHLSELWEIYAVRHTERAWAGHVWVWPEFGNYFGVIGVALVALGAVLATWRRRQLLPAVWATLVFILFQIGNAEWMPWWLLHKLPVIEHLRVPSRFTVVVGMFATLLIGAVVDVAFTPTRADASRVRRWLGVGLAAAVSVAAGVYLVDAAQFNREQWAQTFGTPAPTGDPFPTFSQQLGDPNRPYLFPRKRAGSLICFEESPLDVSPYLRSGLTAEEFPADPKSGTVRELSWSPNRIVVEAEFNTAGAVVVNQNFEKGWRVDGGERVSAGGLLAAKVEPGKRVVTFRYLPTLFLAGLAITLLALAAAAWQWWRWGRPSSAS